MLIAQLSACHLDLNQLIVMFGQAACVDFHLCLQPVQIRLNGDELCVGTSVCRKTPVLGLPLLQQTSWAMPIRTNTLENLGLMDL